MKLSPERIKMIGALSLRWPDHQGVVHWDAMRDVITECRALVSTADQRISEVTSDRDLSDTGRLRKMGAVALDTIGILEDPEMLKKAETAVARFLEQVDARKGNLPKAPTTPADVQLHAEIRGHIAKQKGSLMFAMNHRGDPLVVAAVIHAPAFLSGMTNEEKNTFYAAAANALWPDDEKAKKESADALVVTQKAVGEAVRVVAERGKLMKTMNGYELPKAAA
jgi:hypothetical protein